MICTDPYVLTDPDLEPMDTVLARADLLIIATPHPEYRGLAVTVPVADIWNILGKGVLV